ncbi:hypothetical protein ACS0TY_034228 [Phlomoides rotata]
MDRRWKNGLKSRMVESGHVQAEVTVLELEHRSCMTRHWRGRGCSTQVGLFESSSGQIGQLRQVEQAARVEQMCSSRAAVLHGRMPVMPLDQFSDPV